jgi:hypothetical protein
MKRQTRPFIVEIKQSRHGSSKSAPKSLWSGHDLHLLKEARPERQVEMKPAPAPVRELAAAVPPARILVASDTPLPVDDPAVRTVRTKPRMPRVKTPVVKTVQTPVVKTEQAAVVKTVQAPVVKTVQALIAAAIHDPKPNPPTVLRDSVGETLPRGQRWKRRLPKVIW